MVDGSDWSASAGADQYWDRLQTMALGDDRLCRTLERSRMFEQQAERHDRYRPRYPDAVIDRLNTDRSWRRITSARADGSTSRALMIRSASDAVSALVKPITQLLADSRRSVPESASWEGTVGGSAVCDGRVSLPLRTGLNAAV